MGSNINIHFACLLLVIYLGIVSWNQTIINSLPVTHTNRKSSIEERRIPKSGKIFFDMQQLGGGGGEDNPEFRECVLISDELMIKQDFKSALQRLTEAKRILERVNKIVDNDFNARAALLAIQSGQGEEALKLTEMVNLTSPGTLLIHAVRGWSLKEIGYEKRAQSLFTFVLDMVSHTDSIMDSFGAAISSQLIGSELALFFYNQLIDQYNNLQDEQMKQLNKIWLIHALLKKYELVQDSTEKKECLLRVLQLSDCSVGAYNMLGEAFFRLGRYELSLECYMESIDLNPEGQWFRHIRASVLLLGGGRMSSAMGLLGEFRKSSVEISVMYSAMSMALQVLKSSNDENISLKNRLQIIGLLFYFLKHFESSQLILRAAMSLCPNQFDYHIAISLYQALRHSRRYVEGIEVLEQIRNSSSIYMDHPPLLALLADLHSHVNNNDIAEGLYLKVIQLQPLEAAGLYKYVKFLNKQNRLEDSLNVIQKAIYLEPKKIKLLIMKALIFSSLKRLPEAYATYEEVLQINPRLQSTRFQLSQINYVLRKYSLSFDQMMQIKKGEVGYEKSINLLIKLFVSQPDALTPEQREFGNKSLRDNLSDHLRNLGEPNVQKKEQKRIKARRNQKRYWKNNNKEQQNRIKKEEEEKKDTKKDQKDNENQEEIIIEDTEDEKEKEGENAGKSSKQLKPRAKLQNKSKMNKKEGDTSVNGTKKQRKSNSKILQDEIVIEEDIYGQDQHNNPDEDDEDHSEIKSQSDSDHRIEEEQEQEEFEIYKQLDEDPMDSDEELEELEYAMDMPQPYSKSFIEFYLEIAALQKNPHESMKAEDLKCFLEANTYPKIEEIERFFLSQQSEFNHVLSLLKLALKVRDIHGVLLDAKLDQLDQFSSGNKDQGNQLIPINDSDDVNLKYIDLYKLSTQLLRKPLFASLKENENRRANFGNDKQNQEGKRRTNISENHIKQDENSLEDDGGQGQQDCQDDNDDCTNERGQGEGLLKDQGEQVNKIVKTKKISKSSLSKKSCLQLRRSIRKQPKLQQQRGQNMHQRRNNAKSTNNSTISDTTNSIEESQLHSSGFSEQTTRSCRAFRQEKKMANTKTASSATTEKAATRKSTRNKANSKSNNSLELQNILKNANISFELNNTAQLSTANSFKSCNINQKDADSSSQQQSCRKESKKNLKSTKPKVPKKCNKQQSSNSSKNEGNDNNKRFHHTQNKKTENQQDSKIVQGKHKKILKTKNIKKRKHFQFKFSQPCSVTVAGKTRRQTATGVFQQK